MLQVAMRFHRREFATSISELARGEKLHTQSINHLITQPANLIPREPKLSLWNKWNLSSNKGTAEAAENIAAGIILRLTSCSKLF